MKKYFITFSLICTLSFLIAQNGEWEINLFRTHLKMSYPLNDEHESIRKSANEKLLNRYGGSIGYKYMITKKFGAFMDFGVFGNRFDNNAIDNNYSSSGNDETYATTFNFSIGFNHRINIYKELKANVGYGIVNQISDECFFIFGSDFTTNKMFTYTIGRASGLGYKLKFNLQYPIKNTKLDFLIGYTLQNTYLNQNIYSIGVNSVSYTTNLSYLYQNFCIGIQF